jgi:hypothetical protein
MYAPSNGHSWCDVARKGIPYSGYERKIFCVETLSLVRLCRQVVHDQNLYWVHRPPSFPATRSSFCLTDQDVNNSVSWNSMHFLRPHHPPCRQMVNPLCSGWRKCDTTPTATSLLSGLMSCTAREEYRDGIIFYNRFCLHYPFDCAQPLRCCRNIHAPTAHSSL